MYDGREFTSYTSSKITSAALDILLTSTVTPKTTAAYNLIAGFEVNSSSSRPGSVKYLRSWSYK
jgi:hypothetical protein